MLEKLHYDDQKVYKIHLAFLALLHYG